MSLYHSPSIVTSGLVLNLDPANSKSFINSSIANHGYADWYCFVTGTVTYSIINASGGIIYENNNGVITTMVTATGPQRGTFTITAGRKYYGNVAINLVVEDAHHAIAPLTMSGTQFLYYSIRSTPTTYYIYSPYSNATINYYDNTSGGLTGTPTSTISLNSGQSTTLSSPNYTYQWLSSNVPILVTATQTGADKTILSPMTQYVYQRYLGTYVRTTNNTSPTNNEAQLTYDSIYNVMSMTIADGAGSDCAQGLGLEYLSDTYSWGNTLSDYVIVFPYNNVVTSQYWNGTSWVIWDTHTITDASITNPIVVTRDGTNGPGVAASSISGSSTNMASGATLWRWVGNSPFYLGINDSVDDEFSVLGHIESIIDISNNSNNGKLVNKFTYNSSNRGSLVFNGTDNTITLGSFFNYSNFTINLWVYPGSTQVQYADIFDNNHTGTQNFVCQQDNLNTNTYGFGCNSATNSSAVANFTLAANTWHNLTFTWNNSVASHYTNGNFISSGSAANPINYSSQSFRFGGWGGGGRNWNGRIGVVMIYNRVLTATEIRSNFNALRGRYEI